MYKHGHWLLVIVQILWYSFLKFLSYIIKSNCIKKSSQNFTCNFYIFFTWYGMVEMYYRFDLKIAKKLCVLYAHSCKSLMDTTHLFRSLNRKRLSCFSMSSTDLFMGHFCYSQLLNSERLNTFFVHQQIATHKR